MRCLNRYVVAKNVVAARPDILCRSGNSESNASFPVGNSHTWLTAFERWLCQV
jgi:hypothetical protein